MGYRATFITNHISKDCFCSAEMEHFMYKYKDGYYFDNHDEGFLMSSKSERVRHHEMEEDLYKCIVDTDIRFYGVWLFEDGRVIKVKFSHLGTEEECLYVGDLHQ